MKAFALAASHIIQVKTMRPALTIGANLKTFAAAGGFTLGQQDDAGGSIEELALQISEGPARGVQVGLVAYDGEDDVIHLFIRDGYLVPTPQLALETIVHALGLADRRIGWFTRTGDARWPGNTDAVFRLTQPAAL